MKCRFALTAMLAICTMTGVNAFADDDGGKDGRPRGPWPGGPPKAEDIFKRIDSNGDGKVTLDEFKKAHERLQAAMHRRPGPPQFRPGGSGPPHFRPGGPGAPGPRDAHRDGDRGSRDHRGRAEHGPHHGHFEHGHHRGYHGHGHHEHGHHGGGKADGDHRGRGHGHHGSSHGDKKKDGDKDDDDKKETSTADDQV